jgi:site-specific DNA-methyltransferase (cytosine-N4-specific)
MEADFSPNPSRHPARFPLTLPTFFINLMTQPGQMVVDPFGGTGTTGLAAQKLERRWLLTELDARYAAVVPSRFQSGR